MGFLRRLFGGATTEPAKLDITVRGPSIYIGRGGDADQGELRARPERRDLRAASLPPRHQRLRQGPPVDVMSESKYRADIERAVGRAFEGHQDVVDAVMAWEPANPYDPNAIAIQIDGRTCGYLPRGEARRYRPVMEALRAQGIIPVVRADVRGGWHEGGSSWADFGIRIFVDSPNKLLGSEAEPTRSHPWVGQLIAFTGDSCYSVFGEKLDRDGSVTICSKAGIEVHPRVTKKVTLLVDCDPTGTSGNQRKAAEYGIAVIEEGAFWAALGIPAQRITDSIAQ